MICEIPWFSQLWFDCRLNIVSQELCPVLIKATLTVLHRGIHVAHWPCLVCLVSRLDEQHWTCKSVLTPLEISITNFPREVQRIIFSWCDLLCYFAEGEGITIRIVNTVQASLIRKKWRATKNSWTCDWFITRKVFWGKPRGHTRDRDPRKR